MTIEKPTKMQVLAAVNKTIPDVIALNLNVLFCGINPGLYTAATGHHFARPGNRFWKALHLGGFTPYLFHPSEQDKLLDLGYGITNVVKRASLNAAALSTEEFIAGGKDLEARVREYQPKWLAVLGVGAYRKAFDKPKAKIGRQSEKIGSTNIWVLPNPSGLNAHYTPQALGELFKELHQAVEESE